MPSTMGLGPPQEHPHILGLHPSKKISALAMGRNYFSLFEFRSSEAIEPLLGQTHSRAPWQPPWPEWLPGGEKWGVKVGSIVETQQK